MGSFLDRILRLFDHPIKLGLMASGAAFLSLLIQGTLIDLWTLQSEKIKLKNRLEDTLKRNEILKGKIEQARNSERFIGRQAREKLDLVEQDELVFIFENESPSLMTPPAAL